MKKETELILSGKKAFSNSGTVNIPIHKTSTVLFPNLKSYIDAESGKPYYDSAKSSKINDSSYGISGTPTTFALQEAMAKFEGQGESLIYPSGLSAISSVLLSLLQSGDHLLMVDTVYGPTRRFCNSELKKFNIETTYYDPKIGENIEKLIKKNTKLIFTETPGSLTFELQDIPAICNIAKKYNILVALDNSWATPYFFDAFAHGVDISILAGTKYIGGHSDLFLGTVTASGKILDKLYKNYRNSGIHTSPEVCYMALRGLKTIHTRLKTHQESALKVAKWLENHKKVTSVLHPALDSFVDYNIFKRDFSGSSGLFSFILDKKYGVDKIAKMIDGFKIFGIGASWGGFESLVMSFDPSMIRTASKYHQKNSYIRLYIGLENPDDLISELDEGLKRL